MQNKKTDILQISVGNAHILRMATLAARQRKNLAVDYHMVKNRNLGGGLEMVTEMAFRDLSKYKIVHNLAQHPFFPMNRGGISVVTTAHELQEIQFPELTPMVATSIKSRIWRYTVTLPGIRCLLKSDYATVTSQLLMEGILKAGFPKERVFMTPLGIEKGFITAKRAPREPSMKGFRIGTVGTIGPQKNTFFSIDAVRKLEGEDVSFEIWGKSVYRQEQLQERIGGDPRITVKGYVPEAKKVSIYDTFDVFLFPSIFEGYGIPIMEAKARGLPVILMKEGKISPEVRQYCLEARSPEHMADLVQKIKENGYNPKQRKKAVESARKCTLERMGTSILDSYEEILSRE